MKICPIHKKQTVLPYNKCYDCKWKGRLNIHNWNELQVLIGKKYITRETHKQIVNKLKAKF